MDKYLYRSEDCYGSGEREIRKVIAYETNELGNTDIWEYCIKHYDLSETTKMRINSVLNDPYNENNTKLAIDSLVKELSWLYYKEPRYCVWLTDFDSCVELYGEPTTKCLASNIVLSDLGEDGKLYAYFNEPNEIDITE